VRLERTPGPARARRPATTRWPAASRVHPGAGQPPQGRRDCRGDPPV